MSKRLSTVLVLAVIVITVVISLGSNLWGSTYLLRSDTVFNHAPWAETVGTDLAITPITGTDPVDSGFPAHAQFYGRASDGDFAEWNPYPSGGVPLGAVPNTGPFDPLNLPFWFLPEQHAPTAGKVLELALAVGGMLLFLRRIGIGNSIALVGGLIYAFNGFQTFWTNWPQSHIGALIPWLFWAGEGLLANLGLTGTEATKAGPARTSLNVRKTLVNAVALVLITAAMLLAGFPALTAFALGALVLYLVARTFAVVRARLRRASFSALSVILAVGALALLGAGLVAWQLAPFSAQIETVDTEYRLQTSQDRLPTGALLTTAVPNALGSFALDRTESLHNYFEIQSFIGAGALVLVGAAFLLKRPRTVPPWLVPTLALLTAGTVVLIYFGGPLLALAQQLPVVGTNLIGRLRAVFLFLLSVLAAIGLAAALQHPTSPSRNQPNASVLANWLEAVKQKISGTAQVVWRFRLALLLVGLALVAALAAAFWHFTAPERSHGHGDEIGRSVLLAAAAALVVVAVLWLARQTSPQSQPGLLLRAFAPMLVAAVAAVEILVLAVPFWPNTDPELHYPTTEVHQFLQANGPDDRIATHVLTMYSGTTGFYGIRTVSGHSFHWPTWRDLLLEVDPAATDWNDTFTIIDFTDPQRMQSPVLDRLAVRWIVTPLHIPPAGEPAWLAGAVAPNNQGQPIGLDQPTAGTAQVQPFEAVSITAPAEPLRGVAVFLSETLRPFDSATRLKLNISTSSGQTFSASRSISQPLGPGWLWMPIAAETISPAASSLGDSSSQPTMTLSVSLQSSTGRLSVGTTTPTATPNHEPAELAAFVMRPGAGSDGAGLDGAGSDGAGLDNADGLRLAHVSGAAVWENLNAVPRIRFAPLARSVPDPDERLNVLAQSGPGSSALASGEVVLSAELPQANPLNAAVGEVIAVADTFDEITIAVQTDGPGYVVVADAMQHGWEAIVNGEPAEVLHADHAVVAVAVPAGASEVELFYNPPRLNLGIAVSAVSVLVLLGLLGLLIFAPRLFGHRRSPA